MANLIWNGLGARLVSQSGRQLFAIDKFRDTGRPLLSIMADPNSIFMSGLAKFKRRTLYTNITNDRSAVYYTTAVSKTDPFTDLSKIEAHYVPGYEDVILDPSHPVSPRKVVEKADFSSRLHSWIGTMPWILALMVFVPIGTTAFLATSVVQTIRSSKRIKLYEKGMGGIKIEDYRMPLMINELRGAVEDAYENLNSSQNPQYLTPSASNSSGSSDVGDGEHTPASEDDEKETLDDQILSLERKQSHAEQPTLALTANQFRMIKNLDKLGWRKYPVWIHKVRHSHAAIIVRMDRESFSEGQVVLSHWLNEEFLT
jgi:hypothetical protein